MSSMASVASGSYGYYTGDIPYYPWQWQPTYYNTQPIQLGWECPRCHFIYGPMNIVCNTCNSLQEIKNQQENLKAEQEKEDG